MADHHQYPVITAHKARREDWLSRDPELLTTSVNRNLLQPTRDNKERRRSRIRESIHQGKHRRSSRSGSRDGALASRLTRIESDTESSTSDRSQLVDLVVEDTEAEEGERVRARKEGGATWNVDEPKHFIRTYSEGSVEAGEDIRQGFEPRKIPSDIEPPEFAVGEDDDEEAEEEEGGASVQGHSHGVVDDERNVWDFPSGQS